MREKVVLFKESGQSIQTGASSMAFEAASKLEAEGKALRERR